MPDIKYEILKTIGILSENSRGWTKELNLISWNGGKPKYDIRDWAPAHEKMGKGVLFRCRLQLQRRKIPPKTLSR